jgi:hypothetical protein
MRNRFRAATLAVVLLAAACGDVTSPADELTAARRRWEAWGPASYDLVVGRGACECLPGATARIVVAVRNGTVSRYHLEDGRAVVEPYLSYPDVPGFFEMIAREIADGRTVAVRYDAATGAPLQIDVDRQDWATDGGYSVGIALRNPGA